MFQAGVSEKLIQQRTGHRSLQGLRQYERTTETQLVDVSNIMSTNKETTSSSVSVALNVGSINDVTTKAIASSCGSNPCITEGKAPVFLSGCNFNGCTITFSGPATNISHDDSNISAELLKGINVDDIFDDV